MRPTLPRSPCATLCSHNAIWSRKCKLAPSCSYHSLEILQGTRWSEPLRRLHDGGCAPRAPFRLDSNSSADRVNNGLGGSKPLFSNYHSPADPDRSSTTWTSRITLMLRIPSTMPVVEIQEVPRPCPQTTGPKMWPTRKTKRAPLSVATGTIQKGSIDIRMTVLVKNPPMVNRLPMVHQPLTMVHRPLTMVNRPPTILRRRPTMVRQPQDGSMPDRRNPSGRHPPWNGQDRLRPLTIHGAALPFNPQVFGSHSDPSSGMSWIGSSLVSKSKQANHLSPPEGPGLPTRLSQRTASLKQSNPMPLTPPRLPSPRARTALRVESLAPPSLRLLMPQHKEMRIIPSA